MSCYWGLIKLRNLIGCLVIITGLFGCGSSGGDGSTQSAGNLPSTPKGSPPTVSGLTYSVISEVNSANQTTIYISGTVNVSDPDGDITNVVIAPLGQTQAIIATNTGSSTSATVPINFSLIIFQPETCIIDVFAIDSGYNQSNKITSGIYLGKLVALTNHGSSVAGIPARRT
jgi:hypothetical protein